MQKNCAVCTQDGRVVSDVAEAVATRKDRFVKKYVLAVLPARYVLFVVSLSFFHISSIFILCATDFQSRRRPTQNPLTGGGNGKKGPIAV